MRRILHTHCSTSLTIPCRGLTTTAHIYAHLSNRRALPRLLGLSSHQNETHSLGLDRIYQFFHEPSLRKATSKTARAARLHGSYPSLDESGERLLAGTD